MKRILIILLTFTSLVSATAQEGINAFDSTILISGKILNVTRNANEKCLVELLDESGNIKSLTLRNGKKSFAFDLHRNTSYTIHIAQEGSLTKILTVNTVLPPNVKGVYDFSFNIQLISSEQGKSIALEARNLSVALIRYDLLIETFVYDLSYATSVKMKSYRRGTSVKSPELLTINE